MSMSEGLTEAVAHLDSVSNEAVPSPYDRVNVEAIVAALRLVVTEVDALQNP